FELSVLASRELHTLSLHDALPIFAPQGHQGHPVDVVEVREVLDVVVAQPGSRAEVAVVDALGRLAAVEVQDAGASTTATSARDPDRKSTRLNSSHSQISYAVFCSK